jgi:hypothetical protein
MGKVLNPAQVAQIFKLREELDDWGDPKYSGAYIAEQLGVSEATVWRVLKKRAAYTVKKGGKQAAEDARWNALNTEAFGTGADAAELARKAAESEARMLALMNGAPKAGLMEVPPEIAARARELLGERE